MDLSKTGRNDPCPCGSGVKFKKCCFGKPAKPKFTAKVLKSGGQTESAPTVDLMARFVEAHQDKLEKFEMSKHDFRVTTKE